MVYESGFTTRRTYTSRPVVSSYTVSRKPPPIDWEKVPYVPRPTLISDPVTAFGRTRPEREQRKRSILDPINTASIKPDARILNAPIGPYIPARDKNRERILSMVRQHIDTVEAGGNTAARTSRDSIDTVLPRLHRAASESLPYPTVSSVSRVYKTSYPIYSSYTVRRPYVTRTRVIASPIRVVSSPTRFVSRIVRSPSPVRVTRTTTRVISSPERTTSYSYSTPLTTYYSSPSYLPSTYYTSSYVPSSYVYSTPSYVYSPISRYYTRSLTPVRIVESPVRVTPSYLKRTLPGYGARQLTNYLSTEPFTTFREETDRIRHRANSLIRDIHTPVVRRARSCTPFPVGIYEPTSQLALDAYVARVTNPIRHVAKEVHNMSHYAEPARRFVGKSHLASVRICGDTAYNIRRPMYDTDKVRTDINLMSWYLRQAGDKKQKKIEDNQTVIEEVADLDPNRPSRKFSAPQSLDDPVGDDTKEKQRLRQERLLTVNEEMVDEIELEKKKAQRQEEAKRKQQQALEEEVKRQAQEKEKKRQEDERKTQAQAAEAARREEEARAAREAEEAASAAEAARQEEEAAAAAEAARKAEEERAAAEAEAARQAEEERLAAEAAAAEAARKAEEEAAAAAEAARIAEEERLAAEEAARKEEEERLAAEEAARQAEEQRQREEELNRLAEIEKQAEEDHEVELARQAAELAEIAAQESQAMQQAGKESDADSNVTAMIATEPIVNEPPSPQPDDAAHEPTIELSTSAGNAESLDMEEQDDEEEEEEDEEEE